MNHEYIYIIYIYIYKQRLRKDDYEQKVMRSLNKIECLNAEKQNSIQ